MFGDLYSMEADNDEIDVCMQAQVNDETAVTEAGTDTEASDVSNIDAKTDELILKPIKNICEESIKKDNLK